MDILLNNAGLALGTAPVHATASSDALGMITTNISAVVCPITRRANRCLRTGGVAVRGNLQGPAQILWQGVERFASARRPTTTAHPKGSIVC